MVLPKGMEAAPIDWERKSNPSLWKIQIRWNYLQIIGIDLCTGVIPLHSNRIWFDPSAAAEIQFSMAVYY